MIFLRDFLGFAAVILCAVVIVAALAAVISP